MYRRALYVLLIGLTIFYGIRHWDELVKIPEAFRGAHFGWVFLAVFMLLLNLGAHTLAYRAGYLLAREKRSGGDLLPSILASFAVNVAAPTLNTAGLIYMVDESKSKGHGSAGSLVGILSANLIDGTVFLILASLTLVAMRSDRVVNPTLVVAAIILAFLILIIYSLLVIGWRKPLLFEKVSKKFRNARLQLFHAEWLALTKKKLNFKVVPEIFAWELVANICKFTALALLFPAFGVTVSLAVPVLAFVVATLFTIISITPSGLGVVEGALTLALVSLGVPLALAGSIMFVYRVITFWLPLAAGLIVLQRRAVRSFKVEEYEAAA